jgi:hypothetical protein
MKMAYYSKLGSEKDALIEQQKNKVSADLSGKWFHGTNSNIKKFNNKNAIWLSRS